jgi:hypothetical protein
MKASLSDELTVLSNYVHGLYEELDKLAKKSPSMAVSDFALARINRALREGRDLLKPYDRYANDIAEFVPAGDNPEVRDAVMALREEMQAIGRVRRGIEYGVIEDEFRD